MVRDRRVQTSSTSLSRGPSIRRCPILAGMDVFVKHSLGRAHAVWYTLWRWVYVDIHGYAELPV